MKITAFHGSPRLKGNTDLLLKETIKAIEEEGHSVKIFRPSEMSFSPCTSCGSCTEKGICVIKDDMTEVYRAIRESDRFIVASPVYFFSLPAQLKAIIDRCQCIWAEKYVIKKKISAGPYGRKGLLILVSAMKTKNILNCCNLLVKVFFNTISVPKFDILSYTGVDKKGEIKKLPEAFEEVYEAGKKLVSGKS